MAQKGPCLQPRGAHKALLRDFWKYKMRSIWYATQTFLVLNTSKYGKQNALDHQKIWKLNFIRVTTVLQVAMR